MPLSEKALRAYGAASWPTNTTRFVKRGGAAVTLTREGLEEALKLAGASEDGPWIVDFKTVETERTEGQRGHLYVADTWSEADAAFIAFSREAVPAMAQALLRVMEVLDLPAPTSNPSIRCLVEGYEQARAEVRAALLGSDEAR